MNNNESNQFNNDGQSNFGNQVPYSNNVNMSNVNQNNGMMYNQVPNNMQNIGVQQPFTNQFQGNQLGMNNQYMVNNQNGPMTMNQQVTGNVNPNPNQFKANQGNMGFVEPTPIQPQPIVNNQVAGNTLSNQNINDFSNPILNSGNGQLPPNNFSNSYNNVSNKKNKKDGNKSNPVVVILLILVIIGCVVWTLYYLSTQGYINFGSSSNSEISNNVQSNNSIKLDDSKDYVYDAVYQLETSVDSYELSDGTVISKDDIRVPYININSDDATEVNKVLNNLYGEIINDFNDNSTSLSGSKTANYLSFDNGDILSLIVEIKNTDLTVTYDYYAYNFNLKTGYLMDYNTSLTTMNYTKDMVDNYVAETLSSYIHSICDGDSEGSNQYCSDDNGYEQLYNSSLADYNKKVSDGNLNYYFDGNQLYIVLSPASLAQNSGFNILFNVISKEIVIIES